MKVILSHPTGNANVRAVATGFVQAGILSEFHTTVAAFPGNVFERLAAFPAFSEIKRRRFDRVLGPYIKEWPWYELGRFAASKIGFHKLIHHETGIFSIDAVYRNLDKRVAQGLQTAQKNGSNAIYAYEDGAAFSFREAKRIGMSCLYDLPIGYWRSARGLLNIERELWPEWAPTLSGFRDSDEKLQRKDEELLLADKIFVASTFTAQTLKDFPGVLAPVEVIPYGFPVVGQRRSYETTDNNRPLKLLFVGGLSQRKGIANLFKAVEKLGSHVELTVVGQKSAEPCQALDAALAKHKWIPSLPHEHILKLMRANDVLVFPSLFEGFGLVITEAMSQGTPVITTNRTAGNEFIEHGKNGWLVEAGSTSALEEIIEELLLHPEVLAYAGQNAMETARTRPWNVYGNSLAEAINGKFLAAKG